MLNVEFIYTWADPLLFTNIELGIILKLCAVPAKAAYVKVDCW